jgi:hypothetical protein
LRGRHMRDRRPARRCRRERPPAGWRYSCWYFSGPRP